MCWEAATSFWHGCSRELSGCLPDQIARGIRFQDKCCGGRGRRNLIKEGNELLATRERRYVPPNTAKELESNQGLFNDLMIQSLND
jgi:hypothetical protein